MLKIDLSSLQDVARRLKHDVELIQDLEQNDYFREVCKNIIKKNFREVWSSQGASINEDWNERTLVKTGNLRDSLTTNRINITITKNTLIFNSTVPYASFVNDLYKFYGLSAATENDLSSAVGEVLRRQGKLNWTTT